MTDLSNFTYPTKDNGSVVFSPFSQPSLVGSNFNERMFREFLEHYKLPHLNETARFTLACNLMVYFWIMTEGATKSFSFNKNLLRKNGLNGSKVHSELLYELYDFFKENKFITVSGKNVSIDEDNSVFFNKEFENLDINGNRIKKENKSGPLKFSTATRDFNKYELAAISKLNDPQSEEDAKKTLYFIEINTNSQNKSVMISTRLLGRILGCSDATARRRIKAFTESNLIKCSNTYSSRSEKRARYYEKHDYFITAVLHHHDFSRRPTNKNHETIVDILNA